MRIHGQEKITPPGGAEKALAGVWSQQMAEQITLRHSTDADYGAGVTGAQTARDLHHQRLAIGQWQWAWNGSLSSFHLSSPQQNLIISDNPLAPQASRRKRSQIMAADSSA